MEVRNRMLQREYVLLADRDLEPEKQTVFIIKGLTYDTQVSLQAGMAPTMNIPGAAAGKGSAEWDRIMAKSTIGMVMSQGGIKMQYDILSEGLVDVLNLRDTDTQEILEYPKGTPSRQIKASVMKEWLASWLPDDVRKEIADEITRASVLADDDVKNL